jgi:DNA-binding CsgD family transcriptional regulator
VFKIEHPPPKKESVMPNEREKEVLTWIARGKTAWEVGQILTISPRTVESYLNTAKKKLGAVNTVQAVSIALRSYKIMPSFLTYGAGVAAFGAWLALRLLHWMDLVGGPGGIS